MGCLVMLRESRIVDVVELSTTTTVGCEPGLDFVLADLPATQGRLTISRFGSSFEVRRSGSLPLSIDGRDTVRKLLARGDRLQVGPWEMLFFPGQASRTGHSAEQGASKKLLEALGLLARRCHSAENTSELLEQMIDGLLPLLGAERGFILATDEAGALSLRASRKIDAAQADQYSKTVIRRVRETGKALMVADASSDPALLESRSVRYEGIRSVLAAPLTSGPAFVGAIYLDCLVTQKIFDEHDVALVEAVGEHVATALANAKERETLRHRTQRLKEVAAHEARRGFDLDRFVVESEAMRSVMDDLRKVAGQTTTTLVLGESGTGKEMVARAIHDLSSRREGPFVAVNCMALAPELLESELFGHEKGSFTGATARRIGRFELAESGTIFLDEIGDLDPRLQGKLLRVLQERSIERVGSSESVPVDVRLICATNVDLKEAVQRGRFREDLYYRIAVFPVHIPPLRDRVDDILPLVNHFLAVLGKAMGRSISAISDDAAATLRGYRWPGNVRELRNVVERALVLEGSPELTASSLPLDLQAARPAQPPREVPPGEPQVPLKQAVDRFEKEFILRCLERHDQNINQAARELGVPRSTVYRRLQAWGQVRDGRRP